MSGAIRVLKADLKANIENLGGVILGLMVAVGFLALFFTKIIIKDTGIFFTEFVKIILLIMTLFTIGTTTSLSQAQSLADTFPLANKLGNKRSDIAIALILKDIIVLLISGLIMYLLTNLFLSNLRNEIVESFIKLLSPTFIINFVLGISSVSLVAGSVAYIFKVNPLIGSFIGIIFAFALFLNTDILSITRFDDTYLIAGLFIIGQIIRFYIINKLDARF